MNGRFWWLCALGGSLAWGQTNPAASRSPAANGDQNSAMPGVATIPMDAAVITLHGFCAERKHQGAEKQATDCETVITRAQFEKMAEAIRPNMTASVRQQLASLYTRLLVMTNAAEELGLDKQPPYDEMIAFSRMQILAQGLTRKLQADSASVSEAEIAEYYRSNPEVFDEYTLERLVVPLRRQPAQLKTAEGEGKWTDPAQPKPARQDDSAEAQASERDLTQLAEKLRARAAAGEHFLNLQREAFEAAGINPASASVRMDKVRRAALPSIHTAIFQLKAGEVSAVVSDAGGHYIYKLDSKDRLTIEQAKKEIRDTLKSQRARDAVKKIENSYTMETNTAYFGTNGVESER